MEEIVQLKDEAEQKILTLEKQKTPEISSDSLKENENLKEIIKLLEMERLSSKNVCEQALKVLDSGNLEELKQDLKQDLKQELKQDLNQDLKQDLKQEQDLKQDLNQELKLKQAEIEKLKGREQHFKESNEIFQQKLLLLTEENRKLKGQRPLNHY